MQACRCITTTVLASLALAVSIPAQDRSSLHQWNPLRLEWPSTAEYRCHEHHHDRPKAERDYVHIMANDSQGRILDTYKYADGQSSSHVLDPVASEEIWWGTYTTKAKVVNYPTPVPGRPSCWQSSGTERSATTGRTVRYEYKINCQAAGPPAGQGQAPNCRDSSYAERLAAALPPEKTGFPKCDASPGGTAEDLGMSTLQGIAVHGCRRTTPFPNVGEVRTEEWIDEYGLTVRDAKEYQNGDKFLRELVSLSRDEPDLSVFQPPRASESMKLEMEEVPCQQTKVPVIAVSK
jgi:hypothetical protein